MGSNDVTLRAALRVCKGRGTHQHRHAVCGVRDCVPPQVLERILAHQLGEAGRAPVQRVEREKVDDAPLLQGGFGVAQQALDAAIGGTDLAGGRGHEQGVVHVGQDTVEKILGDRGAGQVRAHPIEAAGQVADLVACPDVDLAAPLAASQALDRLGQQADGTQDAACE